MHQGTHFGKNKPDWQLTHAPVHSFNLKYSLNLKLLFWGIVTQSCILLPIVYWSLQNYTFFENNIPTSYNLKNYINTEKQWIIFLYIVSVLFSAGFNLYLITKTKKQSKKSFQYYQSNSSDHETLPDATADRRHAS